MILNKILIGGRIASDLNLRVTPKGTPVCNFNVAYNPPAKRTASGAKKDADAVFVPCVVWGKAAEKFMTRYTKGAAIFLEGVLQQDEYDYKNTGIKVRGNVVKVDLFQRPNTTNLNLCKVFLSGSVTQKPTMNTLTKNRTTPLRISNLAIVHFHMPYTDGGGQKREQEPVLIDCTCLDTDAANVAKYIDVKQHVLVEGTFYTHKQVIKGVEKPRSVLRIRVDDVKFLKRDGSTQKTDSAPTNEAADEAAPVSAGAANAAAANASDIDEDVPF